MSQLRQQPDQVSKQPPLHGVRVLDLTRVLAGPYCTLVLADLGADVIKIEDPTTLDYTRTIPPLAGDLSHFFLAANRGKRSVELDLKSSEGRDLFLQLTKHSDVVVENYRPGVMQRLGIGYSVLRDVKPEIILCSISGFGQTGALRDRPAVDAVVQALSGIMALNGSSDGPPEMVGLPIGDLAGSMWATVGILAALRGRAETGQGTHVDVSLLDSLISLQSYLMQLYLTTGTSPVRKGSRHQTVPAYGRYRARDGYIVIAVQMQKFWQNFCNAIGRPDLTTDPRFATVVARRSHYDDVERIVEDILSTRSVDEWLTLFKEADIPHAPVLGVGEALEQEHIRQRGLIRDVHDRLGHRHRVVGSAVQLPPACGSDAASLAGAPLPGEHTGAVLSELSELDPARSATS